MYSGVDRLPQSKIVFISRNKIGVFVSYFFFFYSFLNDEMSELRDEAGDR